jgi:hypothetical protein
MTTATETRQRECTAEEGAEWQRRFSEGYRLGRDDVRWNAAPRMPLVTLPPDDPYETGSQYVARHVSRAFEIGYTRAYAYETGR